MSETLTFETRQQADKTPARKVKRWLLEIKLAQKREKDWRECAKKILERYRAKKQKTDSFNILWANTETLRPAVYNSPPKPDVRRRWRQSDMLGKAVGELTERALTYCTDAYDMDCCIKQDVLDSLLPGRGVSRVCYIPQIKENEKYAEVEYEQALCEHVQWDDFLHGPGRTWEEVGWVAFRHKLTRDDLIEKFGEEIGGEKGGIELNASDDDDLKKKDNDDVAGVFKRAELWEIWDKDGKEVFFLCNSYKKNVLYPKAHPDGEPPLKLKAFFPVPRPLQMIEDSGTLVPEPLYELYRAQAEELDRISARINKIVNACRVRFAHDPSLTELSQLMEAGDNIGIPVENARAWMANGGLDKAIWWMPVEQIAKVLVELYTARESCKQVIYELTGISDIVRGATDPNETLGAQQLKAEYSNLRLARMQKECARYVRDLIRLLAEVIGENFSQDTLKKMTGMNFPTALEKQQMQLVAQTIPPGDPRAEQMKNALSMPTWEEIMGVLKSDMQREYRIDVETNSTIAETLSQDMTGLREVLGGLTEFWNGVGPAVQAKAISIKAVKEISLVIARRARMGLEVEDAIETGLQEPQQAVDPAAQAAQQQAEIDKAVAAKDAQLEQQRLQMEAAKMQGEQQLAQATEQREQAVAAAEQQREAEALRAQQQIEDTKRVYEERIAAMEANSKEAIAIRVAEIAKESKREVAEIMAQATVEKALASATASGGEEGEGGEGKPPSFEALLKSLQEMHQEMKEHADSPIEASYGADGRIAQVKKGKRTLTVKRSEKGVTLQ